MVPYRPKIHSELYKLAANLQPRRIKIKKQPVVKATPIINQKSKVIVVAATALNTAKSSILAEIIICPLCKQYLPKIKLREHILINHKNLSIKQKFTIHECSINRVSPVNAIKRQLQPNDLVICKKCNIQIRAERLNKHINKVHSEIIKNVIDIKKGALTGVVSQPRTKYKLDSVSVNSSSSPFYPHRIAADVCIGGKYGHATGNGLADEYAVKRVSVILRQA
jgi:hypothetical protein